MADVGGTAPARDHGPYFGRRYVFQEIFHEEVALINGRRSKSARSIEAEDINIEVAQQGADTVAALEEKHRRLTIEADGVARAEIRLEEEGKDVEGQTVFRPNEESSVVGLALSGGGIRSAAFCLGALQALDRCKVLPEVDYLSTVSGGGYIGASLTAALETSGDQGKPQFPFKSALKEDEPPALQQIRNYSNYLFPRGKRFNFLRNAAVYGRGLAINVLLMAQFVFALSAITLLYYQWRGQEPWQHFSATIVLLIIIIGTAIAWGFYKSWSTSAEEPEYGGFGTKAMVFLLAVLAFLAFAELQPVILDAMLDKATSNVATIATDWFNSLWVILAPISAAFSFLANKLGEYVKSTMQSPQWSGPIKAGLTSAAIFAAGLVLPISLWVVYLDLTYWGICINHPNAACMAPFWLADHVYPLFPWPGYATTALYTSIAVLALLLSLPMQPNANSLHALYRDRLKKAFLFEPQARLTEHDLPAFTKPLSEISSKYGPYHLLNAALNVQSSKRANRRGRNADFFIFSPKFLGSKVTGYVSTRNMEEIIPSLSLATAMATSGAAVSSNMGAQSIKALTPSLALLNIRLGYWLRNPIRLKDADPSVSAGWRSRRNFFANYYFILEILGLLNERRKSIYLTDGGHIENLGIYELLRRRCRVIIAVDAEADPQMAFGSFNMMERYALIDMGIRIDLPWQKIANESLAISAGIDHLGDIADPKDASMPQARDVPKDAGPHCAIGEIMYPDGHKGVLVYIKASLTGDENDTVIDYKKRYSAFPHETTLDQTFTEEQFEAYRALGFHAAFRLFDRDDTFAHLGPDDDPDVLNQIGLLDRLFPRPKPDSEDPPQQKTTFAGWLTAKQTQAKVPPKPRPGGRKKDPSATPPTESA